MASAFEKIVSLDTLLKEMAAVKKKKKRLVHCHGVFDLIHPGHIRHLETAKRLGDLLIVTVTPDRFVNKGPGRPIFPEALRAENLAALHRNNVSGCGFVASRLAVLLHRLVHH